MPPWATGPTSPARPWASGANFYGATLGGRANFSGVTLGDRANFYKATLGERAFFVGATLGDGARFSDATLEGMAVWQRASFLGTADFSGVNWNAKTHYGGAFDSARFEDLANFKTGRFHAFAALSDAAFKQRLLLQPASGGDTTESIFKQARTACEAAIATDLSPPARRTNESDEDYAKRRGNWTAPDEDDVRERRWGELSAGYRTAKAAMEAQGDFEREQAFYRFEVKARVKKPSIGWFERRAAGFYALWSNYGESIWRPFAGLSVFTLVFASAYFALAVGLKETPAPVQFPSASSALIWTGDADDAFQSLEFSLNNAFRPLSALATQEPIEGAGMVTQDKRLFERLLFENGAGWGVLVRLMVIIQSLLSFVLAFLFALAVRRKFQIS